MEKKDIDKLHFCNTIVYTIKWNPRKSIRLKRIRGVSFEEIIHAKLLGIEKNPNRYNQRLLIYEYKGCVWAVPFVVETGLIFLKTIFPSRKFKKIYRKRRRDEKNKID